MKDYDNFKLKFKICLGILIVINLVMFFVHESRQNFLPELNLKDFFIYLVIGVVALYFGIKMVLHNFLK